MATPTHCIYCFESLVASLTDREPLSLLETETLYGRYQGEAAASSPSSGTQSKVSLSESSTPESVFSPPQGRESAASSSTSVGSGSTSSQKAATSLAKQALTNGLKTRGACPLFITFNTISSASKHRSALKMEAEDEEDEEDEDVHRSLRGCIGTFEPLELEDGLRNYALISAFEDHRFRPISKKELPSLECAVTLLTDFEPAKDVFDWELGKHGIKISFRAGSSSANPLLGTSQRRYSATYLPDVAVEQGWNKEETLVSLIAKAGWSGRKSDWKKLDIDLVRYQGKKVAVRYDEYKGFREWMDAEGQS